MNDAANVAVLGCESETVRGRKGGEGDGAREQSEGKSIVRFPQVVLSDEGTHRAWRRRTSSSRRSANERKVSTLEGWACSHSTAQRDAAHEQEGDSPTDLEIAFRQASQVVREVRLEAAGDKGCAREVLARQVSVSTDRESRYRRGSRLERTSRRISSRKRAIRSARSVVPHSAVRDVVHVAVYCDVEWVSRGI